MMEPSFFSEPGSLGSIDAELGRNEQVLLQAKFKHIELLYRKASLLNSREDLQAAFNVIGKINDFRSRELVSLPEEFSRELSALSEEVSDKLLQLGDAPKGQAEMLRQLM